MNSKAKKWIKALRSGTYKQGMNALHNVSENKFCCLGVACDLFVKSGGVVPVSRIVEDEGTLGTYDEREDFLPIQVQKWLGLRTDDGTFETGKSKKDATSNNLGKLNDDGKSFDEIADIIESEPRGLFE